MRANIFTHTFGGKRRTFCNLYIEDITITDTADIERAKELTDKNFRHEVLMIDTKYTRNQLFKDVASRIYELAVSDNELTEDENAEYQALWRLSRHFNINY